MIASDGYLIMVSLGEIDPNFGNEPALRLVFPGDRHGARDVRGVVRIEVR